MPFSIHCYRTLPHYRTQNHRRELTFRQSEAQHPECCMVTNCGLHLDAFHLRHERKRGVAPPSNLTFRDALLYDSLIVLWFCFILKLALSFTMLQYENCKMPSLKGKRSQHTCEKGEHSMGKMRSIRAYGLFKLLDLQIAKCSESASGRKQSLSALLHLQHVWPRGPRCTCFKCNTFFKIFKSMALDFLDFETNQSLFNSDIIIHALDGVMR